MCSKVPHKKPQIEINLQSTYEVFHNILVCLNRRQCLWSLPLKIKPKFKTIFRSTSGAFMPFTHSPPLKNKNKGNVCLC